MPAFVDFFAAALAADFLTDALDAVRFEPARLLSAVLKADEGVNLMPFDAAILTGSPVCGLRPVLAARNVGVKVPNPKIDTLLPPVVSDFTASMKASTALSARRLSSPVAPATDSTSSRLFTRHLLARSGKFFAIKDVFSVQVKDLLRSTHALICRLCKKPLICNAFFVIPLEDGIYDVLVVDASEDAERDEVRVEVTITSGRHKGEVVAVRAASRTFAGDAISLLGQPGTLTVNAGNPSLRLD